MDERPTPFEALKAAVDRSGSQSEFARICGVGQPTVWKWINSSKRLPAEHVLVVEAETGIDRRHLRPDLYPLGLQDGVPFSPAGRTVGECAPVVSCHRSAKLQAGGAR